MPHLLAVLALPVQAHAEGKGKVLLTSTPGPPTCRPDSRLRDVLQSARALS